MGQGGFVVVTIPAELFIYLELCCMIELTCFSSRKLHEFFFFHTRLSFWDEHRLWYILMCGKISGTGPNISCKSKTMVVDKSGLRNSMDSQNVTWSARLHVNSHTPKPKPKPKINLHQVILDRIWRPRNYFSQTPGPADDSRQPFQAHAPKKKGREDRDPLG